MKQSFSRRALLKHGLIAGAVPVFGLYGNLALGQTVPLDPADPGAKALGYVLSSANPAQNCGNCLQFKGAAGAAKGPCAIFPGKEVPAAAYCKAWAKKA